LASLAYLIDFPANSQNSIPHLYSNEQLTKTTESQMSNAAFSSIINDAIHIITNPVGFYRQMAKSGGYAAPIVFVIVMAVIAGLMVAILSLFGANMSAGVGLWRF